MGTVDNIKTSNINTENPIHVYNPGPIIFSAQQEHILSIAEEGRNIFFTGPAGTGKSVLLKEIIFRFSKKALNKGIEEVAVTASTGIAALNIGGRTLHSFAGIGLGKEDKKDLAKRIQNSHLRSTRRLRWLQTKVLIIDEISMVDGSLFDTLEYIARAVRGNNEPFGGIQLILCGDFFQLPPVPDKTFQYEKPAIYAFDAKSWSKCISRPTFLTHVFRQKDTTFIDILTNMRRGALTANDIHILKSLSRPLIYEDGIDPSQLFPLRRDVDDYNRAKLEALAVSSHFFPAQDSAGYDIQGMPIPTDSAINLLERMMAQSELTLKVGAQVMLIKNIDEDLVNGKLGKVTEFSTVSEALSRGIQVVDLSRETRSASHDDSSNNNRAPRPLNNVLISSRQAWPLVQFEGGKKLLCAATMFTINGRWGNMEACRIQVPLILAWALSIHKAQGQTLTRVKVDLAHTFEKGQAYVALSRATSMDGLEIQNFEASKVFAHQRVIQWHEFWESIGDDELQSEIFMDDIDISEFD